MRCDLWHLHSVKVIVLLANMLEVFFPVHGYHWTVVLIQIQKTHSSTNHRLHLWLRSVFQNALEALVNIIRHRKNPRTGIGLCILNHILHRPGPLQLMVHINRSLFQINVLGRQPNELRNTKSSFEQDIDTLIVF